MSLESFKNFDFDLWRQRYLNWIQAKKLCITDFFRRQDKDCDGALTRREFVEGMLQSKFPTNKTELNAVFDIFDQKHTGRIDYRQFTAALKPDRHKTARMKTGKRQATDSEQIHDEIERQVSQCQCRHQYKAEKIDEGQYRFGENLKLKLVRSLNSCVMVRVGGGWVTLDQFLETNDPCRARSRTNTELRETFVLADGVTQTRTLFRSKTPDPLFKKRLSDDYASSNSSAGSSGSPLRRSKMGTSMINLSCGSNSLYDHHDFGSNGSLSRSKRLSTSSNSLSSTKSSRTPKTPGSQYGSPRPKTPTMNSASKLSTSASSTPPRPHSVTPNTSRCTTPIAQRMGASRRLPTTPKTSTPKTPRPKTPSTPR